MASLDTIEGIGPVNQEKLNNAGVNSCEDLLAQGASKQGRAAIAEGSGLSEGQVLKFVNHADLMRISGIGGEYAELLECAGVDTVPELAQRNAANLTAKMAEVNEEKSLVRSLPAESQVEGWVEQAKGLDRVVTH